MKLLRKIFPHPILTLILTIVWLLLNNNLSFGQIILGGIVATFVPFFTSRFWPEKICIRKPLVLLNYIVKVVWDILVANIVVAKLVLGPNSRLNPGFLVIELDIKNSLGISILANTISLTPGTVSCNLSLDRKRLLVHALNVDSIEDSIKEIKERYEKPLMEVFVSC